MLFVDDFAPEWLESPFLKNKRLNKEDVCVDTGRMLSVAKEPRWSSYWLMANQINQRNEGRKIDISFNRSLIFLKEIKIKMSLFFNKSIRQIDKGDDIGLF